MKQVYIFQKGQEVLTQVIAATVEEAIEEIKHQVSLGLFKHSDLQHWTTIKICPMFIQHELNQSANF